MIFSPIEDVFNQSDFIEKVLIYIRIVEVIAERNTLVIIPCNTIPNGVIMELQEMGIIKNNNGIFLLEKYLGNYKDKFIACISFYLTHKILFGDLLYKLNNKQRAHIQSVEKVANKPTFVDFFSGAGGLSWGFTQAGFRVCLANDFMDVCVRTYKYNHPELPTKNVLNCDIRTIADHINDYIKESIDVVIGGPPCQGFSSANQQRIIDDPRNELYKYYIKAISKILPKFVVMENVKGMLSVANQVIEDYENLKIKRNGHTYSYSAAYKLLNAADFSVAQNRERLIYLAIRDDITKTYNITPMKLLTEIENHNKSNPHYLLHDALEAIKPLEAPREKRLNEIDSDKCGKKIDNNFFDGNENAYLRLINGGKVIPILYNHKARYVNEVNYEIYRLLNQGDDASDPKVANIMPYTKRLYCFKDKYYKLIDNKPSRTITAHLCMDCHSHIHPFQIRAITPREAARCQSFPDDYFFLGPYLKTYMQIGNAVPCLMAKGIATIIKKYL